MGHWQNGREGCVNQARMMVPRGVWTRRERRSRGHSMREGRCRVRGHRRWHPSVEDVSGHELTRCAWRGVSMMPVIVVCRHLTGLLSRLLMRLLIPLVRHLLGLSARIVCLVGNL